MENAAPGSNPWPRPAETLAEKLDLVDEILDYVYGPSTGRDHIHRLVNEIRSQVAA